jgi:hypothetical protein
MLRPQTVNFDLIYFKAYVVILNMRKSITTVAVAWLFLATVAHSATLSELWEAKNPWFGNNKQMTDFAFDVHHDLISEGSVTAGSRAYYDALDDKMRSKFPKYFDNPPLPLCSDKIRGQRCQDSVTLSDGSEYLGEMLSAKPDGNGRLVTSNGTVLLGQFKDGLLHGQGSMEVPDKWKYEGEWQYGQRHGFGTQKYSDGSYYEGEWRDDIQHGYGKYFNKSLGDIVEGQWNRGRSEHTSDKAVAWARKNPWFQNDEEMTEEAYKIHKTLIYGGTDPESDEYYQAIDRHMQSLFPQNRFEKYALNKGQTQTSNRINATTSSSDGADRLSNNLKMSCRAHYTDMQYKDVVDSKLKEFVFNPKFDVRPKVLSDGVWREICPSNIAAKSSAGNAEQPYSCHWDQTDFNKKGEKWNGKLIYDFQNGRIIGEVGIETDNGFSRKFFYSGCVKAQQEQQQSVSNDTKLPTITIASATAKGAQGIIRGRVNDNTGIAELRVDGQKIAVDSNGNFSATTYVPEGGTSVNIEAIDLAGLSSTMSVRVDRANIQTTSISFDRLNPLKRKAAINNDALALVIGVSEYKETNAKAIYADSDAKVFQDYAIEKLGVPRSRVKTLVNDGADEKDMLLATKRWLARAAKQGKTDVYIFFAGHGLASDDGSKMYLLPYDGAPELLDDTAILRDRLFSDVAAANPRSVTVFLDTCYSGTTRGTDMLIASRPIAIRALEQSIPDNFTVMTAAAGDQTAKPLEEAKHGMFSYFLMKGMEGEADANNDNEITAGELHSYVQTNVIQQSSGSQTPELQGDADRVLVRFQ